MGEVFDWAVRGQKSGQVGRRHAGLGGNCVPSGTLSQVHTGARTEERPRPGPKQGQEADTTGDCMDLRPCCSSESDSVYSIKEAHSPGAGRVLTDLLSPPITA